MKPIFVYLLSFIFFQNAIAQTQQQLNSAEILHALKKLKTVGSVLYIAAHPDDENTRLLAYMANEKKLKTAYLSLTRGDGGQNLIGKEQAELLGLIRTQELLAARRTDGAEQFFTRANDFGYSKNPEETFSFWNKDSVLSDMVWVIRNFKPDVIICRFPTTGEGGHGHHTASALLAQEAFDAAADPLKYPEQLKLVDTWQTKRLFWNTFNFGGNNTTAEDQLKIDVGIFNPLLGKYYGEIAADSRSMHKSQGFGSAKGRGSSIEYFKHLKGTTVKSEMFEGIDLNWKRFKETEPIEVMLNNCITNYNAEYPENSISDLTKIYTELQKINSKNFDLNYWKQVKLKETENLILTCSGFWAEAYSSNFIGVPGNLTDLTIQILAKNKTEIKLNSISYLQNDSNTALILNPNELYTFKKKVLLENKLAYSNPYWLNEDHSGGLYIVRDQLLRGKPQNIPATTAKYNITINGINFIVERAITYKYVDPVKGEIYRPWEILPPACINFEEKAFVFSGEQIKKIHLTVKANANNINGSLSLKAPEGWLIKIKDSLFTLNNKGDEVKFEAQLISTSNSKNGKISAEIKIENNKYNKSIKRIEYDHIPYQFILSNAEAKLIKADIKITSKNIGYIDGAGDEIPACLQQIGYNVTILNDETLSNSDLSKFDAIVTGIRAYNINERLQIHYNRLMNYIKDGGNLIVQYNTNSRVGPVIAKIGPYPFTISRDRVTDESAAVEILNSKHPVLNFPNKINSADFENWIQERGIYFAGDIDSNYEKIFSMKDPNEKNNEGSLIIAKFGKGNFVYTGLALFRELPAGVPGAYRLFANLLSLPKNK